MVERDVVIAKVATLERCVQRIREVRARPVGALLPVDVEDIVVLNLTRAAQAAIDLASHVVTTEALGIPDSLAATFTLLERAGVLESSLAGRMRKMVGFRNIAVHEYESVDPAVIEAIATRHLDDLLELARVIAARYRIA